jgi:hypothetical protein
MANNQALALLTNQVGAVNGAAQVWAGGTGQFTAWGTWGGGTCKLQWSPDAGTTWLDVDRAGDTFVTFTANGSGEFTVGACLIRAVTSGTIGSVSADARGSWKD